MLSTVSWINSTPKKSMKISSRKSSEKCIKIMNGESYSLLRFHTLDITRQWKWLYSHSRKSRHLRNDLLGRTMRHHFRKQKESSPEFVFQKISMISLMIYSTGRSSVKWVGNHFVSWSLSSNSIESIMSPCQEDIQMNGTKTAPKYILTISRCLLQYFVQSSFYRFDFGEYFPIMSGLASVVEW